MNTSRRSSWFIIIVLGLATLACNIPAALTGGSGAEETLQALYLEQTQDAIMDQAQPTQAPTTAVTVSDVPTSEPTPTVEVIHTILPGNMGWVSQYVNDTSSASTAGQKRAPGGDNIGKNLYERPFTATEMLYRPDVDLQRVEISSDANFFYFQLILNGVSSEQNTLAAHYGVELDTDIDGRGDLLVWAQGDGNSTWNIDHVFVYRDGNNDVGGSRPVYADAPNTGDGYEQAVFSPENLQDPDAAWKRVSPNQPGAIQLAVKKSLLGGTAIFMWDGWADDGVKDPARFDYDDSFTAADAGSPISGDVNYPLKALSLADNTCRLAFGFEPTGNEPGGCVVVVPTEVPTPPPTAVPPPCDCASFPNYTFMTDQACCTYCGHTWTGNVEFPCEN